MGIVINISKALLDKSGNIKPGWNGEPEYYHLFATAERSLQCVSDKTTKEVLSKLTESFPSPMYNITITAWSNIGTDIDAESILNIKPKEV